MPSFDIPAARAVRAAVLATLASAMIGVIAWQTGIPFLFPALGASTFIVFALPGAPAAAPRNVVLSHFLGATTGWSCLQAFSVDPTGATLSHLVGLSHVFAASVALGITTVLMLLLRTPHPPAGATTLIVALGSMPAAWHIGAVVASCLGLVGFAHVAHRAAGITYPLWSPKREPALDPGLAPSAPRA